MTRDIDETNMYSHLKHADSCQKQVPNSPILKNNYKFKNILVNKG